MSTAPSIQHDRYGSATLLGVVLLVSQSAVLGACQSDSHDQPIDAWLQRLQNAEHVDAEVSARIDAAGGTPIVSGDDILFLVRTTGADPPRIIGDFNDGGFEASELVGNGTMRQIADSSWYGLKCRLPRDARFEYQVAQGQVAEPDPLNPRSVQTFGAERSVVAGPAVRQAPHPSASTPRGRLEQFTLSSSIRENERTVSVYLPASYQASGPRLATLYVKDGTRFRTEGGLPAILDAIIERERMPPALVVFVDPVNRALEYGTAAAYRRFVVEELVPEVERRYASGGSHQLRALFGASRGGLAVVDLAVHHPDVFGFTVAMSPALSPLPMIERIADRVSVTGHFLVMISRFDTPDLVTDGRELVRVLESRADSVAAIEMPIDHSIHGWRRWLDVALMEWGDQLSTSEPTKVEQTPP